MQKGTRESGTQASFNFYEPLSLSTRSALGMLEPWCSAAGVKLALGTPGWIFGSKVQSVMQDEREFAGCLQIYIYDAAPSPPPLLFCHANKIQKLFRLNTGGAAFLKRAVMTADRRYTP
jgi:hypothetical protein